MAEPRSLNHTSSRNWTRYSSLEDIDVPGDGSPALRVLVSVVYSVVCAAGLLGNLLVFFLMSARRDRQKRSTVDLFVLNLAVTDFQFVLTLPFWAADTALDFSWPFGTVMCKLVLSVTVMNIYASAFFLTAMSVTRYWSVAFALKDRTRRKVCSVRWVVVGLWVSAGTVTLPSSVFSTVRNVDGETLCLVGISGQLWQALYHLQKVLLAFVVPMSTITVCYVLLLLFVRARSMNTPLQRRRSRLTRSVTIVVLTFFLSWMPNHVITVWGVLVKLDLVNWDQNYYLVHTYVYPVTVCLAQTNSCLNPVLYCLTRPEMRRRIKNLFWRISSTSGRRTCSQRSSGTRTVLAEPAMIPLNTVDTENCRLSALTEQDNTEPVHR
ncbi:relaxin-3 receptor 1 [Austrofundulus limnaeus]|uniref:Relaxin-3 receptor 1 n=1 Tax=Austrofundulus limnaeus TaxID=52670 RepID=A0A2I4CXP7_AUSLI|nr:PREDICTED: relaxin-3 receptor 1-like [Austrofundulus limnaeus]